MLRHEIVQPTGDVRPDVRVSQVTNLMNGVDGFLRWKTAIDAIQHRRHDAHQAAVAVVLFMTASAEHGFPVPLVPLNGRHRRAADVVGIAIGREGAVVEPIHEILHDVGQVNGALAADALQQGQRQ